MAGTTQVLFVRSFLFIVQVLLRAHKDCVAHWRFFGIPRGRLQAYLEEVKGRIGSLQVKFVQIPREENECADRLAKAASAEHMLVPNLVLSFVQVSSLIDDGTNVQEIGSESNWTTQLVSYLKNGMLPDGKDATRKLKIQASRFVLIKDILYKRGFSRPYLRCLGPEEAEYVMREVHEGIAEITRGHDH